MRKKEQTYFKTKKMLGQVDLLPWIVLATGVGRDISSGIEMSRAGGSKHNPRYNGQDGGGGKGIKTNC